MYAVSTFAGPLVRQTSPAGSSWLQSACDDGSGSLVPYWVDCRSGQVQKVRGSHFCRGFLKPLFSEAIHEWMNETWSLFDGDIPAETWGIKDFFMLRTCLHISVSSALMHHLSITHLMSIWIPCVFIAHSLHIGPLSCQVFCTHFRRYWPIPFWQLSVLRSKQLITSSFRFFIYGQLWIRKGFLKTGRSWQVRSRKHHISHK